MEPSTGLPGLDAILKGLMPGDNIVLEVDSLDDYRYFVDAFRRQPAATIRPFIYFRFARHPALIPEDCGVEVVRLHPDEGFESMVWEIHHTIDRCGDGALYVFDSLSELATDWNSDQMVGNFFRLTCPYLYERNTIAYFALLRDMHSDRVLQPITDTTQLFLGIYNHRGRMFVHPYKVAHRYSPTMYMLHESRNGGAEFRPILDSGTIAEVMAEKQLAGLNPTRTQYSSWDRVFLEAEVLLEARNSRNEDREAIDAIYNRIARMMFSRDERMLELASRHLKLEDLLRVRNRRIGTGLIGGKAVGMLIARAVLRSADPRLEELLEPHDSFHIGSDVFYTYLVQNGCWSVREKQRNPERYLEGAEEARRRILTGTFPEYYNNQLRGLLNYFGQSPIIVRSSSLLEDNYGNAFAGMYDSVFCANQGPIEQRFQDLLDAIRTIYASSMCERALRYRAQRGLLERDEQMALLIQRVSGTLYNHLFFPQFAGVGLSFNPYTWSEQIDPSAGVLRLVFGLGTRAVDRFDDDYTRIVALNAPDRRPEHTFDEIREHSQRKVDVIDCSANRHITVDFRRILDSCGDLPLDIFTSTENGLGDGHPSARWLSFDHLLSQTTFVEDMRSILHHLHEAYDYPVELEFAGNFLEDGSYRINVLQCRPLQIKEGGVMLDPPPELDPSSILIEAQGAVIGRSRMSRIDRLVLVRPDVYAEMSLSDRYSVARRVGQVMRHCGRGGEVMLLGPGRWGTTQPQLGVSVAFAEINNASVLCEIVAMHENLTPEVSLGTHFFNELVEAGILYLALFPDRQDNRIDLDFFRTAPNRFATLLPDEARWAEAIVVVDAEDLAPNGIHLYADTLSQRVIVFLGPQ